MKRRSRCEWMPMLPWPIWPLAGHARLGQNVVVGSMTILLSWLCWGASQEEVCLDPCFLCNLTPPQFSVELPRRGIVPQKMNITGGYMGALASACLASSQARRLQRLPWMNVPHYLMCLMVSKDYLLVIRAISVKVCIQNSWCISI